MSTTVQIEMMGGPSDGEMFCVADPFDGQIIHADLYSGTRYYYMIGCDLRSAHVVASMSACEVEATKTVSDARTAAETEPNAKEM